MAAKQVHRVVALVCDRVAPFELGVACEVFGLDRSYLHDPWYDFTVASMDPGPLATKAGFSINPDSGIEALDDADTIIVPGWEQVDRIPPIEVVEALQRADERGARLLSVCSGAFVLGWAGVLDGRRCTTHWMYADDLAARFPACEVDPDVLYVVDGTVMTSAGTAAGIDLCLHVVRADHGAQVANALARRMVVPPHRDGGQSQYVQMPIPEGDADDPLGDVLTWAVTHLDEPHSVESLARRANLSPRTFARRFRQVTGTTPHQWLLRQRVLHAQHLLETTDEPVERVASLAGFGSAAVLRQHFGRIVGTSPLAYRRTFQPA
jgi:transcriptional regulator GlxA family with amidase domain